MINSSVNPSIAGQPVTFTATVSPVQSGTGTPSGIVAFYDGTIALGNGALSSGQATLKISTLSVGSHSITAQYGGDSDFNQSNSSVLIQVVLSPQQALQLVINQVKMLRVLNSGQTNSLIVKLQHAIDKLNSARSKTACNDIGAFVNEVNAYVKAGILTQAQADKLSSGPLGVISIEAVIPC